MVAICFPQKKQIDADKPLVDAVKIDINHAAYGCVGRIWLFDLGYLTYNMPQGYPGFPVYVENGALVSTYSSGNVFYNLEEPRYICYYKTGQNLFIPIIQYHPADEVVVGSDGSTYTFTLKLKKSVVATNTFSIERFSWWGLFKTGTGEFKWQFKSAIPQAYNLKIQFFGDHADVWTEYIASIGYTIPFDVDGSPFDPSSGFDNTSVYVFKKLDDGMLRCKLSSVKLTFLYSLFEIKMEVI